MKWIYYNPKTDKHVSKRSKGCITVFKGTSDIYIESWNVEGKKRIEIAYTEYEFFDDKYHNWVIGWKEKKYGIKLESLAYLVIPPNKFDEYVEKDGVEVHEEPI